MIDGPKRAARLRIVNPALHRRLTDPRELEDMLGFLFTRERDLQADLADVRRRLDAYRVRYSDKHGLRVRVGLDTLRRIFGDPQ